MFSRAWLVGCGALLWAGCGGGDLCQRSASTFSALNARASSCPSVGSPFQTYSDAQIQRCSASLTVCSKADQTAIAQQLKCLDKIGACVPGQETGFGNAIGNCSIPPLSAGCANYGSP